MRRLLPMIFGCFTVVGFAVAAAHVEQNQPETQFFAAASVIQVETISP